MQYKRVPALRKLMMEKGEGKGKDGSRRREQVFHC